MWCNIYLNLISVLHYKDIFLKMQKFEFLNHRVVYNFLNNQLVVRLFGLRLWYVHDKVSISVAQVVYLAFQGTSWLFLISWKSKRRACSILVWLVYGDEPSSYRYIWARSICIHLAVCYPILSRVHLNQVPVNYNILKTMFP